MKRHLLLLVMLLQTFVPCAAQDGKLIVLDVATVFNSATGGKALPSYVLWTESFACSEEGQAIFSAIDSYQGDPNQQVSEVIKELKSQMADMQGLRRDVMNGTGNYAGIDLPADTKKEVLAEMDNSIKALQEHLEYYQSQVPQKGPSGQKILERACSHSVNGKVYHGVLQLGKGLWAVSESTNDDGPAHKCLGGWGVIDQSGRNLTDFKYDLIVESDEKHGIIKYGMGYRSGNVLYGLLKFNGAQALPCEYDEIFLSEGNYLAAVSRKAGKAYLFDWYMKQLPADGICYAEPWTRGTSERKVTYYPVIDGNGKVGVYDDHGRLAVPFIYDRCYASGKYLIGVKGPFPKKVNGFTISYDGVNYSDETRYDIFTWECLSK